MAIGDVYRLSAVWQHAVSGDVNVNVFHFMQQDALILDTPQDDLVGRFIDEAVTAYRACVSSGMELTVIQFRTLEVPASGTDYPQTGLAGTLSGSSNLPPQMSPIISWRTPFIGRRFRGRTYMPKITEEHQNDGVIDASMVTALENFADAVLAMAAPSVEFSGWQLVVHSVTGSVDTAVTEYIIPTGLAVQRRRKLGTGS